MLNGKFYTGLPPKMIERPTTGPNRQQSHFFWPDDSQSEPAAPPRARRTQSMNGVPNNKRDPKIEPNKLFSNEFNKSKIEFYDVPDKGALPKGKSGVGNNKSQIQFYDYAGEEQLNNSHSVVIPTTVEGRNLKSEVEKNLKNSPKLQDKKVDVEHIKIITNDVKNIKKILKPSNTAKAKLKGDFLGDFESKLNRKIRYKDEVDERYDYDNEDSTQFYPKSPLPRHRFRSRLSEESSIAEEKQKPVEIPESPTANSKAQRALPSSSLPSPSFSTTTNKVSNSHKHLVSNINFQSNSGYNNETIIMPARRNARSNAVMRVSVGLPEEN